MTYLEEAKSLYASSLPEEACKAKPCTNADLAELERQHAVKLPVAYREFLLWIGRGGIRLWSARLWTCRCLTDANTYAMRLLLESDSQLHLPDDAFVISWSPSGEFYFIRTNEGDDPPVYYMLSPDIEAQLHKGVRPLNMPSDDLLALYALGNHAGADFFCKSQKFSTFILSQIQLHIRTTRQWEDFKKRESGT
jgi:hypothetical protein